MPTPPAWKAVVTCFASSLTLEPPARGKCSRSISALAELRRHRDARSGYPARLTRGSLSVALALIRSTVSFIVVGLLGAVATVPVARATVADDAQILANCPAVCDSKGTNVRALNTLNRCMRWPTTGYMHTNMSVRGRGVQ